MNYDFLKVNGRIHIIKPQGDRQGKIPNASYMGKEGFVLFAVAKPAETFDQWQERRLSK